MARIRLVFVLLALLLALPIALMVERAVDGIAREQEARRRTLAERVFDEMERELSAMVEQEEARPVAHYRFSYVPEGAPAGTRVRSPLAAGAREPWAVAWFQIEADGRLSSPHQPGPADPPATWADWSPDPDLERGLERVEIALRQLRGDRPRASAPVAQAPGTTVAIDAIRREQLRSLGYVVEEGTPPGLVDGGDRDAGIAQAPEALPATEKRAAAEAAPERSDVYDALQSLNRGFEQRASRRRKIETLEDDARSYAAAPPAPQAQANEAPAVAPGADAAGDRRAPRAAPPEDDPARGMQRKDALARVMRQDTGGEAALARDQAAAPSTEPRGPKPAPAPPKGSTLQELEGSLAKLESRLADRARSADPKPAGAGSRGSGSAASPRSGRSAEGRRAAQAVVDPLIGHHTDGTDLVLSRTVWIDGRALRQGLVVDVPALAEHLRSQVFRGAHADPVHLEFFATQGSGSRPLPGRDDEPRYRHRFGDPFESLAASLTLPAVYAREGGGAATLYALSALLIAAAAAGLFALYRMIAVTVRFAERRSNFVAAVSHELKTPLTAIRMYGEMLRDGLVRDESKREEYYATITAESERLSRLINNVLEFSRLEKNTREMSLVTADLGGVVEEAAGVVRPHAESQGFELAVEVEAGLPVVSFDRDALLQVLFNLVDNAVKYASDAQDRRIRIACRRDGGSAILEVRDHGPGVPPAHLRRIFEPFYRGQEELTRTARGTGLGLALVKGLAERMGAGIQGRNRPDGGFEVQLRFQAAA